MTPSPRRPFGLSIALITSSLIFSFVPLTEVFITLSLASYRFSAGGGSLSGIDVIGFNPISPLLQFGVSILFLAVALLAWRGHPRWMRYAFQGAVLLCTAYMLGLRILPSLFAPLDLSVGVDSAREATLAYLRGQLLIVLLTSLYSLWFSNRWSARAFYRGYYTEQDLALIQAQQAIT